MYFHIHVEAALWAKPTDFLKTHGIIQDRKGMLNFNQVDQNMKMFGIAVVGRSCWILNQKIQSIIDQSQS